ncbi:MULTISPECIES: GNAT family N-acetyltransferase [unclassified Gordonia (in: high G+C Gram-positive bacteria)]|uniref:GNAT family N-acetyltransferase n=1 Tax=unclassified Gordonia (in: high G+C Gram-positive bacteria) TaxID=2657482 RepID=UPI0007EA2DC2|nr:MULTISPECIES: GNAT family N-acetyltransferase [unclassified Gordonia (in: high G+C Gram-positive bacteria)]OBC10079.1 aminoglycoside 2'-N-acetyltransferase [Gordonia sp. 852002-50395_SCH5434458]OBC18070.1 aminoglycoside 2'-N-acetyltransferase [Gordonia sp. 852002-50816_SCH5313054-a]OBC20889.1 aminoglycoside 2'-N-acetyltransferase [Gordonia sp. 852002-50816_SCH5313054-c]
MTAASERRVRLCHTAHLEPGRMPQLMRLLDAAFDGDFDDTDLDHALGGMHALIVDESDELIGHAAVVARSVLVDDQPRRCGYVEAVAVSPTHQREGLGGALMAAIEEVIDNAYDLGALGASDAGMRLYESRGWIPWVGTLGVLSPDGWAPTPDDEGAVLVRNIGGLDSAVARLSCDWRAGDVW